MVNIKNMPLAEFFRMAENRTVYAFGAAAQPRNFNERNPLYSLEKIIDIFCDNNSEKWEQDYLMNGKLIPIISPTQLYSDIKPDDILLITSRFYNEIIDMLDTVEQLNESDCYILTYLERTREQVGIHEVEMIKRRAHQTLQIPKTIHYCWFGGNKIPEKERYCIDSWKKQCPDYEIICWTEKEYDVHKNKYMGQAYDSKKWGFVVDFARLDIVTELGGVYLDADVELLKPLDELLKFNAFVGYESKDFVAYGLGFGCIKGHSAMEKSKQVYNEVDFCNADGTLNLTASPIYQTDSLKQLGFVPDGHFKMVGDLAVLPPEFLCGMNVSTRMLEITPNTYAIHHYSASWMTEEERKWAITKEDWIKNRINDVQYVR